jgi:hypothetical protein
LNDGAPGGARGRSNERSDRQSGDPNGVAESGSNGNESGKRKAESGTKAESGKRKAESGLRRSTINHQPSTLFGNSGGKPDRYAQPRRWGFSSPNATIGFEREIPILVTTDRLIVQERQSIRVGKGETREELVKQVVLAVERSVRSWGKPPDSFYWVPTLRFVISPGGNRHYERLAGSVKKLGLQTVAEYRLESPPRMARRRRFHPGSPPQQEGR